MTIKELKDKRAKLIADARQLLDGAENGVINADQKVVFDKLKAESVSISEAISQRADLEAEERAQVPDSQAFETAAASKDGINRSDALRRWILNPNDVNERERREMNLTSGAYVVPADQSFYGSVQEAQKFYGGMLTPGLCTVLNTSTGADLPIPTNDDTGNTGAIVAEEGSHASGTALTVGVATLKAYMFSSKVVKVSKQLLQDSAINMEAFLAAKFAERIARVVNTYFTTGTGSSQPTGVDYAPTTGRSGATGQTTTATADDVIRLYHSVDPAYRPGGKFMFNDNTLLALSLLKDGEGRYLLSSIAGGPPSLLYGKPFVINTAMPDMAASAKSILFGDFAAYYFIRNVMGIEVQVLRELYAENGQIGVLALQRCDGEVVDAGQHAVKAYVNAAS